MLRDSSMLDRFQARVREGNATVCCVFGTRPEAIKLAPLVAGLRAEPGFTGRVVVTSQHREMLDQVLGLFGIEPDADLDVMQKDQSLFQVASRCLRGLEQAFFRLSPDMVVVQGDTLTTFCAALGAFFLKIPVAHVEAGLRTWDKFDPFPEEMNRVLASRIADWHLAPTRSARENLLREGVPEERIFVTGNTVIDAAQEIARKTAEFTRDTLRRVPFSEKRVILVTAHRRESFGVPYREICEALRDTVLEHPTVHVLFPYHMNPNASGPAKEILGGEASVTLVPPLDYPDLVLAMRRAWAVVTDSGGIQEEAPAFGKPVLVLREKTERPEAVSAGTVKLVGNRYRGVRDALRELLENPGVYQGMCCAVNPYGDGKATERILEVFRTGTLRRPFEPER